MEEFLKQAGQILSLLMDIPVNIFHALLRRPDWIAEIVIVIALIVFIRWWRRKPVTIFHKLLKIFPSITDSDTLLNAEREAFGGLKNLLLDGARVDVLSHSRIAQLKKIRSDLDYIQRELNGSRYKNNQELRQIWEFTLHKAATHIAEDYRFDDLAEKIAKMRKQIEQLNPPEGS
jgi:hypothetical protein